MNLTAKNVTKILGKRTVLSHINLELNSGNIYGLIGPNGSGKTMLLRALSGLMSVDSGEIIWGNKKLHHDFSVLPSLGIILENVHLYPNLTGVENLQYLASFNRKVGIAAIRASITRVGLDPNDKRSYRKYSLGMKQRLAIAQAIMEQPEVVMLDEPTNALDEDGVQKVRQIILEEKSRGALVVLASHSREDIKCLADETYRIEHGSITQLGGD